MKDLTLADLTGVMQYCMGLINTYIQAGVRPQDQKDMEYWSKVYDAFQKEANSRIANYVSI